MSHLSTFKTQICLDTALENGQPLETDPGWEILKEAVDAAAAELGLEVRPFIRDYYDKLVKVDFGLSGVDMPRGVGVKVSRATGSVEFVYDAYGGYERKARQICDAVVQNFQAIAVARALESLNYAVDYTEEDHPVQGKRVTVKGVL